MTTEVEGKPSPPLDAEIAREGEGEGEGGQRGVEDQQSRPQNNNNNNNNIKEAAVLICLFHDAKGEYRVILTKRSATLPSHAGEVALPGGKRDKEDEDETATALREAKEEIGLDPSLVKIITFLEPFLSKHNLRVFPVVGLLVNKAEFKPVPNPGEVDAIFDAPLEMFLKDDNHRYKEISRLGCNYRVHFFDFVYNGEMFTIWGLTAGILICCASLIYQRSPAFVEGRPDFAFMSNNTSTQDPKL